MAADRLNILQVNKSDLGGGAASIAWNLFSNYQSLGHSSWMAVDQKLSADPAVIPIGNERYRNWWVQFTSSIASRLRTKFPKSPSARRAAHWLRWPVGQPGRWMRRRLGHEDFSFPGTRHIPGFTSIPPDLIHVHNLHNGYFDLNKLPELSRNFPLVMTLHDSWLLSGHCAHSFDCQRWLTGCGDCPDLSIYPAIQRDGTAYNWNRKKHIFNQSRFYVATPCQWLMDKVENSILASGLVQSRVIHNGVDLDIFQPADRGVVRHKLGLPHDAQIMIFAANGILRKKWRNFELMRSAARQAADQMPGRKSLFIALGEDATSESYNNLDIIFLPFTSDPLTVAAYYQASDLYLHASLADTFPTTILESLACGTPVIATHVGGIPEQVKSLESISKDNLHYPVDEATGLLVDLENTGGFSRAITRLLGDETVRRQLGRNAAHDAGYRFDLQRQVEKYLYWYQEIINDWHEYVPSRN